MNGAKQDSPERCADMMPQQISGQVRERIQECLKAARRNIDAEPAVQQGKGTILVVVPPVPVSVFTSEPGVDSSCEKRSKNYNYRLYFRIFLCGHGSKVLRPLKS